jgi:hypothetical protein
LREPEINEKRRSVDYIDYGDNIDDDNIDDGGGPIEI